MRLNYLSLIFIILSFPSFAQKGKAPSVSWKELRQTHYETDSTAPAAILSDVGRLHFVYQDDQGFRTVFQRTVRIKVYTTAGLDWADVSIPCYRKDLHRQEVVTQISGITHNEENNKIVSTKLNEDHIYPEDVSEHWQSHSFALPNVRVGSVLEYTYTVKSPFLFKLPDWKFQYEIPVRYSEFQAKIPAFYEYSIIAHGYADLSVNEAEVGSKQQLGRYTYADVKYRWATEQVPAFNDESFISAKEDYLAKLTFQLAKENFPGRSSRTYMSTWPQLASDLLSLTDYGRYLKKKDGREQAEQLTARATTDMAKAQAIYRYVNTHIAWNGENRLAPTQSPKHVLQRQNGNSTDINLLLRNMLDMVGIEARPVLLSTRDHGRVTVKYPIIDQFNYSVVHAVIDGQEYLLDGTDPDLPLGMLPLQCINGYGLVVDEQERWVMLESSETYHSEMMVMARLDPESQQLTAQVSQKEKGYAALYKRKTYRTKKEEILGFTEEDFTIKNVDSLASHVLTSFQTSYPATHTGEAIYVDPHQYSLLDANPFKAEQRQHPIDYSYLRTYKYVFNLVIPEGYTVEEVPTATQYTLDDQSVQFLFQVQNTAMSVQVLSLVKVNRAVVDAKHYDQLKALYATLHAKLRESIVLKKL